MNQHPTPPVLGGKFSPLAHGIGTAQLLCERCTHVLVTGYEPRQFVSIGFRCPACAHVTHTQPWPDGEPIPRNTHQIQSGGIFELTEKIDATSRVVFMSSQEAERVLSLSQPRPDRPKARIGITHDGLTELEALLTSQLCDFPIALKAVERAEAKKNRRYLKRAIAWAFYRLRAQLNAGGENYVFGNEELAALSYLHNTVGVLHNWGHHPRFKAIAEGLQVDFNHTVTQMTVASSLWTEGNPVGFENANGRAGQSGDMFVLIGPTDRMYIEVKSPDALNWPNDLPSDDRIFSIIVSQCKAASNQLGQYGGIVALGASSHDIALIDRLDRIAQAVSDAGKLPSSIAALSMVATSLTPSFAFRDQYNARVSSISIGRIVHNPRTSCPFRVVTGEAPITRFAH